MPADASSVADGVRLWWPLIGAVAGQLLALGGGIAIGLRLRSDFIEHDAKDDKRFDAMGAKIDGIHDRIADLRETVASRHER